MTESGSTKAINWRSLRTRIVLLAVVTCAFLAVAAGSFYEFLQSNHTATLQKAAGHLGGVADSLRVSYLAQLPHGISLQTLPQRPAGPPHPPSPPLATGPAHPGAPPPHPPDDPFSKMTASALKKEEGIEGGFLSRSGLLVGYAFPTHEGPGGQKEMPQRERPTIERLAHEAIETGSTRTLTFEGQHDVVLFVAEPIQEQLRDSSQKTLTGAVWLMQRLPEVNRGRSHQLLLASLGFGAAALITALLAFFVAYEIEGGVNAVMGRLGLLEQELSVPESSSRNHLAEFTKVLAGIDSLASSLQKKIESERSLEAELRHKERLSSLGQFAAGIAHELRNPLATIRLRTQMSQQATTDGSISRNTTVILEEVDRLDTMISRLLYFSRPINLKVESSDLNALCASVIQAWNERSLPNRVVLQWLDYGAPFYAHIDRNMMTQVLHNVIENAVQAAAERPKGHVSLAILRNMNEVGMVIEDNGKGFGSGLRQALDPFFTTKETGTGLGLSIAFELVQAHEGRLILEDRPEGGARVAILLPASTRHFSNLGAQHG